jgi:hypothetical protein
MDINLYQQSCYQCRILPELYNDNEITLSGILICYMDGSKKYLKQCCYEAFNVGSYNQFLNYDQQNEMNTKKPPAKILIHNSITCYVYEVKDNKKIEKVKFLDSTKYLFKRDIIFNTYEYNTYKIMTNAEYIKYQKTFDNVNKKPSVANTTLDDDIHFIYLLKERTAVESDINVYKIGKSTQENYKRFDGYHKGFKLLLHIKCDNCHTLETKIINHFKSKYHHYDKFGEEYFEGDYKEMMKDICCLVLSD